jgi:hypothetical protein
VPGEGGAVGTVFDDPELSAPDDPQPAMRTPAAAIEATRWNLLAVRRTT